MKAETSRSLPESEVATVMCVPRVNTPKKRWATQAQAGHENEESKTPAGKIKGGKQYDLPEPMMKACKTKLI